ncbi:MAG TPA: Rne/Rng family ribonuclease [Firmicutes bacterium]|nr:Rne/Rng family ribonuclease [Bacillota bacterium]
MGKEFLINIGHNETRMAALEDGRLVELSIERVNTQRHVGNIYRAKVENVLPGMQAAFVNIGMEKNAFLYVDDLHNCKAQENSEPGDHVYNITDLLKEGEEIIVQMVKEPIGSKGARVVTNLTLPGRYLVLMPTVDYVGVSRRITDEKERERIKNLAMELKPKDMGLIVRTAAEGVAEEELVSDLKFLVNLWSKIKKKAKKGPTPCLLYHDHDLLYRILRDLFTEEIDRLIIDDPSAYEKALELLNTLSPRLKSRVKLFQGDHLLFDAYRVESQIEEALKRKVWLESGAYLVFDQTEALTVVDVNTGKFIGSTCLEDTVLLTNLAAAKEIARQIRLRNLGGIIIIDFIDMASEENRRQVLDAFTQELAKDKIKTNVLGFTPLGLLEVTRKKTRPSLREQLQEPCPHCEGTGYRFSCETLAAYGERRVIQLAKEEPSPALLLGIHPAVASLVIGPGGAHLEELEKRTGKMLFIKGQEDISLSEVKLLAFGSAEEIQYKALPVIEGEVLTVKILEAHLNNPMDGIARIEGYVIDIEDGGVRVGETVTVKIEKTYRTYAKAKICEASSIS